jgi:hypothetical protein
MGFKAFTMGATGSSCVFMSTTPVAGSPRAA